MNIVGKLLPPSSTVAEVCGTNRSRPAWCLLKNASSLVNLIPKCFASKKYYNLTTHCNIWKSLFYQNENPLANKREKKNLINLSTCKYTKQSIYTALWHRNTHKEYRQETQQKSQLQNVTYYNDCLNLEIARHTTLSNAEYVSLNSSWRAEICSTTTFAKPEITSLMTS